jgi:cytochrome b subunit of formate dehydrogenase
MHTCVLLVRFYDKVLIPKGFQLNHNTAMLQKSVMTQMLVQPNWWLHWFFCFSIVYDSDIQRENVNYFQAEHPGREQNFHAF